MKKTCCACSQQFRGTALAKIDNQLICMNCLKKEEHAKSLSALKILQRKRMLWYVIALLHLLAVVVFLPGIYQAQLPERYVLFTLLGINVPVIAMLYWRQFPSVFSFFDSTKYFFQPDEISLLKGELVTDMKAENKLTIPLAMTVLLLIAEFVLAKHLFLQHVWAVFF